MKLEPLKQWICDACGGIIEKSEDGWWEFIETKDNLVYGDRIVHCGNDSNCYYNEQALRGEGKIVGSLPLGQILGAGGLGHMLHRLELSQQVQGKTEERFNMQDYVDIMRRLYLPYWEEARLYWERARRDGFHDACDFSEQELVRIINEYAENG